MKLPRYLFLSACIASMLAAAPTAGQEWPQFRGPDGQGHADTTGLPLTWSEQENIKWKTSIPGSGHSSPVIAGNEIWLTTALDKRTAAEDLPRRTEGNTGSQPLIVSDHVSFHAVCVDRRSGELLSDTELMTATDPQWIHLNNSYATPTPVIENGRLYCHFGTYGTVCLDTETRQVLWRNRDLPIMHENGPASCPVLWGDLIIFHCDGSDRQFIAALNKNTGKLAWKTARSGEIPAEPQLKKAYGTPLILNIDGQDRLVSPAANWLYGYDPATGDEKWKSSYGVLGFSIVARPVAGHNMIFMCTCYSKSELLAYRYDGPAAPPTVVWRYKKQVPSKSSPLLVGDELYFVGDSGGIATCLDAKTGEQHWKARIGGRFSASPLYADGRIYFFNDDGATTVMRPGTTSEQLAVNTLDGAIRASPAAVDGALFIRTAKALYRIEAE